VRDHYAILLALVLGVGCGKAFIDNPILEKTIRKQLNKPAGELTEADLRNVTRLDLSENKLTEMKGLEKFTQLEELHLNGNRLVEVKGLKKLTKLKKLELNGNRLTEAPKDLEKLTLLKKLGLGSNLLADTKGLEKLTQLTWLWLYDNPNLTKAQIDGLQKALPKCKIWSNPKN